MKLIQVFATSARREVVWLKHSYWDLAIISWVPLLVVAVLWWTFSAGLPGRLPIGVMDQDHSASSRQLIRFLQASPGLLVMPHYNHTAEVTQALRRAEVYAVVSIPPDFARSLKQGRAVQVTLLHNAQLGTHSSLVQRDVRSAVATLSAGIERAARNKRGEPALASHVSLEPLRSSLVTLFNPALNYEQFLAAALIPALLHILAMTAGAWAVGREIRDRTVADWLGTRAGYASTAAALLGKLLWPLLGLATVGTLAMLWLTIGRDWYPAGSLTWILLALWTFLALSLAMGALASSVTLSLRTALSATGFITAPAFAFSGVGFPLQSMPLLAQAWAGVLPYTHYIRLQMEQLQMAAPLAYSTPVLVALASSAVFLAALSVPLLNRCAGQPNAWGSR